MQPYGSFAPKAPLDGGAFVKRRSVNLIAVSVNVFFPWLAFSVVFWALSFSLRYHHPRIAAAVVAFVSAAAALSGFVAIRWRQRHGRGAHWYGYFAVAVIVSVLVAAVLGTLNYRQSMLPVYDVLMDLKVYRDVNVGQVKGQQMMDAGYLTFSKGSGIDFGKALGFRNRDTYCVAPITNGQGNLAAYDFWAVGVNCCSGVSSDFHCGQYKNVDARAGIRLLSHDQRPFYKLAVEQAEATYGIRAPHPLFFEWVEDPDDEIAKWRGGGYKFFVTGVMAHLGFSIASVTCAVVAFAQLD